MLNYFLYLAAFIGADILLKVNTNGRKCDTCPFILKIVREAFLRRVKSVWTKLFRLFKKVFVGPRSILWGHWYPLFGTSDDCPLASKPGSIHHCLCSFVACGQ